MPRPSQPVIPAQAGIHAAAERSAGATDDTGVSEVASS